MMALADLPLEKESIILSCNNIQLMELGFIPGEKVCILNRASFGGPLAIRVGNAVFGLRRHEAQCVIVDFN
jgi:Fe2+ transport system protein FeoA